jgi:molybdate transport system substrate-binding protein
MTERRRRPGARIASLALAVLALTTACGSGTSGAGDGDGTGTVTVLAAASLTDTFTELATLFEETHPGVQVALSFGGSSRLAAQILDGAPADVFASADQATMTRVTAGGDASGRPVVFATNVLQIVVPTGNPHDITELADLTAPSMRVALCRVEVPCGAYAAQAFDRAGLPVPPAGAEEDVKAVLAKVQLGEVDAGLVYETDVRAGTGVEGIELPPEESVSATYPAVVLRDAPNPLMARTFVEFLTSAEAQRILTAAGFGPR